MNKKSMLLQRFLIYICPVFLLIVGWNLFFDGIPLDKFNKVEPLMSYEDVVKLVGRGKEVAEGEFQHKREFIYEYQLQNDFIGYITFRRGDDGRLRVSNTETSFSKEKLSQIKIGMSIEEVEARIGPGVDVGSYSTYYVYQLKDGNYCTVGFMRDDTDGVYYVVGIEISGRD